ncbi:ABC-F family ATP-binding cassette domain-containing protein [Bacillaceae bacterium S4-13-56]
MILMQLNQISKQFGADVILSNIKIEVQTRDRIAIVGRNGAGKSTLLKIMAGHMSYDVGEIYQPKDTTLGYLAQDTGLESSQTIWEEMLEVFKPLRKMELELRQMEQQMADPDVIANTSQFEQLLKDYDQKQLVFKEKGGYRYEADIRSVLHGLHFHQIGFDTVIHTLSGGQKTRLALGKLLLQEPDILILDEPTNHLDIDTLTWLEGYLQGYKGAIVIVSHDRYFLDKIVNTVYDISFQSSKKYHGNYSAYLSEKANEFERDSKRFEKQQAEIKRLEDFVQKNIVRASTTKRAQARRKQLEKMERIDRPKTDDKSANFSFRIKSQSGNDVLKINDLTFQYSNTSNPTFSNVTFHINRGESIALVGPNGVGKTTLLKSIIGQLKAASGEIQIGTNVQIGYYDQEQNELNSSKTVLKELWDLYPLKPEKEIRTVLGNFLFSGDDVLKTVSSLSGGEKARLSLAKLMMEEANFLILDEPTNHLDLDSKEVLEAALIDYPGTLLFVSHDRYFINRIATQVIEMSSTSATTYLGDYDYYVEKKLEEKELTEWELQNQNSSISVDSVGGGEAKQDYENDKAFKRQVRKYQRRIEEIEASVEELEKKIEDNEELLCDPDVFQDHERALELTTSNEESQKQMDALMEEWEEIHEKLGEI